MEFDHLLYMIFFDSFPLFKLGICNVKSNRIKCLQNKYGMPIDFDRSRVVPVLNYDEAKRVENVLKQIFSKHREPFPEKHSGFTEFFREECLFTMIYQINRFLATACFNIGAPKRLGCYLNKPEQNAIISESISSAYSLNGIVSIPNNLVMARYRLSATAQKLLLLYIMNSYKIDHHGYISASDVKRICGWKSKGSYETIKNFVKEISAAKICYLLNDKYYEAEWVSSGNYHDGIIELQFSDRISKLLSSEDCIRFNINNILRLKSGYSIRLYQIAKLNAINREFSISVPDLSSLLYTFPSVYSSYGNFKKLCLQVAINEINNLTDISFSFREYKKGHTVHTIIFYISSDTQNIL